MSAVVALCRLRWPPTKPGAHPPCLRVPRRTTATTRVAAVAASAPPQCCGGGGGGASGSTRQGARIDRRWWSTKSTRETDGPTSPVPNARSRPGAAARRAGAVGGSREQSTPTARQRRTGTRDTAAGGDSNYENSGGGSREQDTPTARRRSANPGTRGAKNVKTKSGVHDGGVTLCTIAETTERPVRPGGGGDAPPREPARKMTPDVTVHEARMAARIGGHDGGLILVVTQERTRKPVTQGRGSDAVPWGPAWRRAIDITAHAAWISIEATRALYARAIYGSSRFAPSRVAARPGTLEPTVLPVLEVTT